eukprot:1160986-Pelagomonas_calceolata.AAC.8
MSTLTRHRNVALKVELRPLEALQSKNSTQCTSPVGDGASFGRQFAFCLVVWLGTDDFENGMSLDEQFY